MTWNTSSKKNSTINKSENITSLKNTTINKKKTTKLVNKVVDKKTTSNKVFVNKIFDNLVNVKSNNKYEINNNKKNIISEKSIAVNNKIKNNNKNSKVVNANAEKSRMTMNLTVSPKKATWQIILNELRDFLVVKCKSNYYSLVLYFIICDITVLQKGNIHYEIGLDSGIKSKKARCMAINKGKNKFLFDTKELSIAEKYSLVYIIEMLEKCYLDLSKITDKGYININDLNLPITEFFLRHLNISHDNPIKSSILFNTLVSNYSLLVLYFIVLRIEYVISQKGNEINPDRKIDLNNLKKGLMRMIHPEYMAVLKKRGIKVYLNSLVGFDSEYQLLSSLTQQNELISVQLSGSTHMQVKIPKKSSTDVTWNSLKLLPIDIRLSKSEYKMLQVMDTAINKLLNSINDIYYKEHNLLLEKVVKTLSEIKGVKSFDTINEHLFSFPKSDTLSKIKYPEVYTSNDLLIDSDNLKGNEHSASLEMFIKIMNDVSGNSMSSKMRESISKSSDKHTSRISYKFNNSEEQVSISINRLLYLCMHESGADLSMLSDFDTFKENLDIVGRSFVTRCKPLTNDSIKSKVYIRDTVLIAPMGAKSLAGIGAIYGDEFRKIDIGKYRQEGMKALLNENKELFDLYAIRDSIITLKHASAMEEFYFDIGRLGVPLTISGIGKAYVIQQWDITGYDGYQLRNDIMTGNLASRLTPKIARSTDFSKFLTEYLMSYRGGRNESLMYGIDVINNESHKWYDYDLVSAYTTVMCILGHPLTGSAGRLYKDTMDKLSDNDLLLSYSVLEVKFEFPEGTKYPCIPTRVDDNIDIYPLRGVSTITGPEYIVAKNMGCEIEVLQGIMTPFERISETTQDKKLKEDRLGYVTPYKEIIKELQQKRREHPKKTFYNYMYKEIGNSVYGQVAMGLNGKNAYDIKTKSFVRVDGGVLSNPILASYITGFVRALVSECVNNIATIGGNIVSVTTDGFITDVENLEEKLLKLPKERIICLTLYREIRDMLTTFDNCKSDPCALEIKNVETQGLLSWKTRGQLGFTNGGISAATGFQTKFLDKEFLVKSFSSKLCKNSSDDKIFTYINTGLRSATDIYNKGGQMVPTYRDLKYSLEYDNKRCVVSNESRELLDTTPWKSVYDYHRIRFLKDTVNTPVFKGYSTLPKSGYKSFIETSVRGFIRACITTNDNKRYGIPKNSFKTYNQLIEYIYQYKPAHEVKLTDKNISHLKRRDSIARAIPRTVENELFVNYVKERFKDFDSDLFFREFRADKNP